MKCFLYCRKSSEDQSRQVQSIADQKNILLDIAKTRNLEITEIFTDEKSAGTPYQRTGFQAMMQRIHSGEASIILTWKIDRLSRNPIENGQISWLLQQGIIKEIITPDRIYLPQDNVLLYMVEGAMANQYLRDLSTNVKRGMRSKVEQGIYPASAPIGYLNEGKHRGNKKIIPDPRYFQKIQALWNLLITENYQLADLYRIMEKKYRLDKNGNILAPSTFYNLFRNPFYCGLFKWDGKLHIGTHQAMITQSEFENIQNFLNKKHTTRQKELVFDFKGLFKCGTCNAVITAERKQKMIKSTDKQKSFDYYRCSHNRPRIICKEKPLSKVQIDIFLKQEIDKVHLPQKVIKHALIALKREDLKETDSDKEMIKAWEHEKHVLTKQKKTVENNLALESDAEVRNIMKDRYVSIKIQIQKIEEDRVLFLEKSKKRNDELRNQLKILERAENILSSGDICQKKELLKALGSNWKLKNKKLLYEPNYVCEAIIKVRKSMPDEISMLELEETRPMSEQRGSSECVSSVWWSVWELIRNSIQ